MAYRKITTPGETTDLCLSAEEQQLVFNLTVVDEEILNRICRMPRDQVDIELNLDQLGTLAGSVAVDANNTIGKTQRAQLARVYDTESFGSAQLRCFGGTIGRLLKGYHGTCA
jgi:hypothetical protein